MNNDALKCRAPKMVKDLRIFPQHWFSPLTSRDTGDFLQNVHT